MADHNGGDPGGNGPAEGHQLHLLQLLLGFVDSGDAQVAVHGGVTVAGEVLAAAQHAAS